MNGARFERLRRDNAALVGKLALIAVLMFGFGYALVPLYRAICDALGINVLSVSEVQTSAFGSQRAAAPNTQVDRSRTITVEFDANARGPWHFKPAIGSMQVHPGELATVMYEFRNVQDRTMAAQYTLAPGESRQWPVAFVIDPRLPKDVTTITLSYTFFEVKGKVAATPAGGKAL
jgi:cytochrome c oxidase assembly protein subunit 11